MYKILQTINFDKVFKKTIPENLKEIVKNKINKLKNNPYIGKPLSYSFFRELKIDKFRIYYSIYEDYLIILVIGVSDKKLQQETINLIKKERKSFKSFVEKYLKEENNHDNDEKK
jgi:mRNA-degrading endonuclease RelE of RelBE toxin-antitoxin system